MPDLFDARAGTHYSTGNPGRLVQEFSKLVCEQRSADGIALQVVTTLFTKNFCLSLGFNALRNHLKAQFARHRSRRRAGVPSTPVLDTLFDFASEEDRTKVRGETAVRLYGF